MAVAHLPDDLVGLTIVLLVFSKRYRYFLDKLLERFLHVSGLLAR
jgi:hypothetical protein